MIETTPDRITKINLCDFYQQRVLPSLFARLDRAFPELSWTPTEHDWVGTVEWNDTHCGSESLRAVRCSCPWGFESPDGTLVSWLAYASGEASPDAKQMLGAVHRLADMTGEKLDKRRFGTDELEEAHREFRRQELLEAFFAYCRGRLRSEAGRGIVAQLSRRLCIEKSRLWDLPLGLCDSPADARLELESLGFSKQEITASRVAGDSRLAGRIIIPWRDRWGRIRTVVADTPQRATDPQTPRLYRRVADCQEPFGLDAALCGSAAGQEHLILLGDIWDVLYFRVQGITAAASLGGPWKHATARHWEILADCGVRAVTLALADDNSGREGTLAAISSMREAERSPEVFALSAGSLEKARTPATFTRLHGCGNFRRILKQRLHAYHYAAMDIAYRHKAGQQWTDSGLTEALAEAVEFDANFYRTQVAWQLDRFFWPTILEETGAKWDAVRLLLSRPVSTNRHHRWTLHEHEEQVYQLQSGLRSERELDFDERLEEPAEDIGVCDTIIDEEECLSSEEPPCETLPFAASQDEEIEEDETEDAETERSERSDLYIETMTYQLPEEILAANFAGKEEQSAEAVAEESPAEQASCDCPSTEQAEEMLSDPLDVYQLAYTIWERKGRPINADRECWFEAEQYLLRLSGKRDAAA